MEIRDCKYFGAINGRIEELGGSVEEAGCPQMKSEGRVTEKFDLVSADAQMGCKGLLGLVEQDGRLPGFPMNLGGVCPATFKGIG